ncbi:GNAT family N-acetyltransferase [Paenibacillus hodogayensis]|uniref:GNAT family N-acetyltransferase n=1 Tax=Paenibacillus hodogayensis TaxID=279208 RepID=A0ABV5VYA3_9BACL
MIQLVPVSKADKEILHHLYQFYHYDFSQFTQEDINSFGLYEVRLEVYWQDPRWNPFFIYSSGKIAGFLVVLFENYDVDPDPTHVIYDFMVLRKYRRSGIGRQAAKQAFDLYKANWKTAQMSTNEPAILFWRDVIKEYTAGSYTELFREDKNKYVQMFSTKET